MKILSKTSTYGIRAVLYVASAQADQTYVPVRKIADELNISFHFLTKIFQILNEKKLMISYRGPKGGVSLARPAEKITLLELIEAIEGPDYFAGCILQLPGCGDATPCPLHAYWGSLRDRLKEEVKNTTLAEMNRRIKEEGLRLGETE